MKIGVYLKIWNENRNGEKNPFHKNEVYNALFVCLFTKHCFTRFVTYIKIESS